MFRVCMSACADLPTFSVNSYFYSKSVIAHSLRRFKLPIFMSPFTAFYEIFKTSVLTPLQPRARGEYLCSPVRVMK